MTRSLVLGNGQIGQSVTDVVSRGKNKTEVIVYDSKDMNEPPILQNVDILHICFPYIQNGKHDDFVESVKYYMQKYQTRHVVIWSTVPIGTTKQIRGAVHSPVEGRHPKLASSIRSMTRWIGYNDSESAQFFTYYFLDLQLIPRPIRNSDFTEALKLLSTTEYGINVEFARYKKKVADELGMDFDLTKQWNRDYNKLYHNLGMDWAQKFVLDAPNGPKGGHCVTPNARLLYEQFPDELVKIVGEME